MRVLGIDIGAKLGWGVLDTEADVLAAAWGTNVCRGKEWVDKLVACRTIVRRVVEEHQPDECVIERVDFVVQRLAYGAHCGIRGAAELTLHDLGVPWTYVPVSTLKKWATGHGKVSKPAMVMAARRITGARLGTTKKDNDAADALLAAAYRVDSLGLIAS